MLFNIFAVLYYLIIPVTVFFKYFPAKNSTAKLVFTAIITLIYVLVYFKLQVTTSSAWIYRLADAGIGEEFINMYKKLSNFYCAVYPIACILGYISFSEIIKSLSKKL